MHSVQYVMWLLPSTFCGNDIFSRKTFCGNDNGLPGAVVAAVGIDAQQDEQQEGETPQRGTAVTEEG